LRPDTIICALELTDVEVVEGHVVVGALDGPVVGDRRNALRLGLLRHLDAGLVEVDQQHDRAALGQLLLGDRRVLGGVVLRVLDVGLDALGLERLVQGRPVAILPTARRRRVGKDHAGPLGRLRAAVEPPPELSEPAVASR
jgi:hypothetical protein